MKSGAIFSAVIFAAALSCPAQDKQPDPTPAKAAVPEHIVAAETAVPAPSVPAGNASDTYIIGPSDTLTITVWKEPTLSGALLVRPDGMVSMALLGDVQAAGLTPQQLSGQIKDKLKKYMQDPNVSVLIDQIHSKVVYLLGEVGRKGPMEMTSGMTLLQAISSAGGLTDYANKKKMYLLRNEGGKQSKIPLHYKEALKGDDTFNLTLKPGDTIVVP